MSRLYIKLEKRFKENIFEIEKKTFEKSRDFVV